jgi:hypothetical protein
MKRNLEYEATRMKMIPHAERHANVSAGRWPKPGQSRIEWYQIWNRAFHSEMERLVNMGETRR